jgi:hypothetical protein
MTPLRARLEALINKTQATLKAAPCGCDCDACIVHEARLQAFTEVLALLVDAAPPPAEKDQHRCAACGCRWIREPTRTGGELCRDCWKILMSQWLGVEIDPPAEPTTEPQG